MAAMLGRTSAVFVLALGLLSPAAAHAQNSDADKTGAEITKLEAETRKLDGDNSVLNRLIPLGAALVAAGGLLVSVRKAGQDRRDALDATEETRRKSDEERFDKRFETAVTKLASDSATEQRAGAVILSTLVEDRDGTNAKQAVALLLTLLRKGHQRDLNAIRTLGGTLSKLARDTAEPLDLRQIDVAGLNLNGVELKGGDLAYSRFSDSAFRGAGLEHSKAIDTSFKKVDLRDARFGKCRWFHVTLSDVQAEMGKWRGAELKFCRFETVDFTEVDLRDVTFDRSRFKDVTFERAKMQGASFRDVVLDDASIASLAKAIDWGEAELSPAVRAKVAAAAERNSGAEPSR
jgi:uncharacterized protein YjbI with pentapeptide repeats